MSVLSTLIIYEATTQHEDCQVGLRCCISFSWALTKSTIPGSGFFELDDSGCMCLSLLYSNTVSLAETPRLRQAAQITSAHVYSCTTVISSEPILDHRLCTSIMASWLTNRWQQPSVSDQLHICMYVHNLQIVKVHICSRTMVAILPCASL